MPSKQGYVQGRFKLAHLWLSLSTKVKAHVRRFETPIALRDERAEKKRHPHAPAYDYFQRAKLLRNKSP
jgi:hypothetical protein